MLNFLKAVKRKYDCLAVSAYRRFGAMGAISFVFLSMFGLMAFFVGIWAFFSLMLNERNAELVALLAMMLPIAVGAYTIFGMFFITVETMWFYCGIYWLLGVQGRPISKAVMARLEKT